MFASERFLALNIGASKLVLAEFKARSGQTPELLQYGMTELGIEPDSETDPAAYIVAAIRDLISKHGMRQAPLLMTLSGQAVFPRFVKLPPVGRDKIQQMIAYEAEQNVPFPIAEVVWDYQLIDDAITGDQNVMIVAVKTDSVTEMTDCVQAAGLEPEIVDVASLALYNCARFNYPDLEGCTMLLDIGARSTNLIFIEEGRIFTRSIPVAGNTITQELAKSFNIDQRRAEMLKRQHAFVALGGVYAVTDDETADHVSKVVRNVITRLHAEVNRSINFYRGQQNGSVPNKVLLTGGSSIIPHMDTFFRDKLKVEVEYLNPFVHLGVGSRINPDRVAEDFYALGEVVGLALRRSQQCPIEINLMPPTLVRRKTFQRRLPFFGAAAAAAVLALFTWSLYGSRKASLYEQQSKEVSQRTSSLQMARKALETEVAERSKVQGDVEMLRALIESRSIVAKRIVALRDCLFEGMWLTAIEPIKGENGEVKSLKISGRGFSDKLRLLESERAARGGQATAVEMLQDRIKAQPRFTGKVDILDEREDERLPVRLFTIEVGLADATGSREAERL